MHMGPEDAGRLSILSRGNRDAVVTSVRLLGQVVAGSASALDLKCGLWEYAATLALEAGVDLKRRPEERFAKFALSNEGE